jgi:hypothetical protein
MRAKILLHLVPLGSSFSRDHSGPPGELIGSVSLRSAWRILGITDTFLDTQAALLAFSTHWLWRHWIQKASTISSLAYLWRRTGVILALATVGCLMLREIGGWKWTLDSMMGLPWLILIWSNKVPPERSSTTGLVSSIVRCPNSLKHARWNGSIRPF